MLYTHIPIKLESGVRDRYHNYTFGENTYPGITTVLAKTKSERDKKSLESWKDSEPHHDYISKFAMNIGTQTHQLIEDYLFSKPSDPVHLLSKAHFNRLKQFLHNIDNIYGIEVFLYSEKLKVAGTSDCIAEYNGNLSIIDYKTKRSDQQESYLHDYFLQATAYAIMWEEMTGQRIEQVVILVSSEKLQLKEFIKDPNDFKEELKSRVEQYHKS